MREFLERSSLTTGAVDMFLIIGQMDRLLSRLSQSPRVLRVGKPSNLIVDTQDDEMVIGLER